MPIPVDSSDSSQNERKSQSLFKSDSAGRTSCDLQEEPFLPLQIYPPLRRYCDASTKDEGYSSQKTTCIHSKSKITHRSGRRDEQDEERYAGYLHI